MILLYFIFSIIYLISHSILLFFVTFVAIYFKEEYPLDKLIIKTCSNKTT